MLSTVEMVAVIAGALIMAQAVAWLLQRMLAVPISSSPTTIVRRPPAALWGDLTRAHFHYVRRRTRYQVACPVAYQTSDSTGRGVVRDMSRDGWRIQAEASLPVGTFMAMTVCVPRHAEPIPIARVVVRWSESREFGVSLVTLDAGPAAQLSDFFSALTAVQPMAQPTVVND